uniref:Uncharacterized protein n=1 Tax=Arundo donax TaxID=35708 RepID=A0A0A9HDU7_ARUDO
MQHFDVRPLRPKMHRSFMMNQVLTPKRHKSNQFDFYCVFNGASPNVNADLQAVLDEGALWCAAGVRHLRSLLPG